MDRQCSSCGGFCRKSGCERENFVPAKREWVRLTDDEIIDTANNAPFDTMVSAEDYIYIIARVIEAKLKEKNT